MPPYSASQEETRPHRRPSPDATGPVKVLAHGVLIKWATISTVLGAALVLMGAGWRYADGRWSAAEAAQVALAEQSRKAADRLLALEYQAQADRQRADERHADLRAQLAQIQAQLAQIQSDLRRAGR